MAPSARGRLLIYAPVPLVQTEDGLFLEDQACNGLRLWAENFDHLTTMHPTRKGPVPPNYRPVDTIGANLDRIRILPLPMAYRPDQFLRHFPATRRRIRQEIDQADVLSFSIGGLFGDWGSVASWQAHRMGRRFAVWTDRVESEVVRRTANSGPWRRRLRARVEHRPMWWWETFIIRRAALGLFHGKETYDAYAPFSPQPHIVHDIHVPKSDHIDPAALKSKVAAARDGPIRIVYTGRASAMKGPGDWISVLERLTAEGVEFQATWLGDGPELAGMQARVETAGLGAQVRFAGFVSDRAIVFDHLRAADVFLFCHKTPESPRCLIEALISGAPIVGYDGAFARDLISAHLGGRLVPMGDIAALSGAVLDLARDRPTLARLIENAARDGAPHDDESVFRHRSDLIKAHL